MPKAPRVTVQPAPPYPECKTPVLNPGTRRFAGRFKSGKLNPPAPRMTPRNSSVTVLLLGDSHCRFLVHDLCSSHLCAAEDWGRGAFLYQQSCRNCLRKHVRHQPKIGGAGTSIGATAVCTTTEGDRLGFLHIYGAQSTGPYLHGVTNNANDTHVDTPSRVCAGIAKYSAAVRVPDAISFSSLHWDMSMYYDDGKTANPLAARNYNASEKSRRSREMTWSASALDTYARNVRARLRDIRACKPPTTQLFLQTTRSFGMSAFRQYNDVLRSIAASQMARGADFDGLLDVDAMLEEGRLDPPTGDKFCDLQCRRRRRHDEVGFDSSHLNPWHSARFARHVLETVRERRRLKG